MPLLSLVAVPVVRPEPSRNVLVPLLSVLTVPVIRPLASRKVDCCADAVVVTASMRTMSSITTAAPIPVG